MDHDIAAGKLSLANAVRSMHETMQRPNGGGGTLLSGTGGSTAGGGGGGGPSSIPTVTVSGTAASDALRRLEARRGTNGESEEPISLSSPGNAAVTGRVFHLVTLDQLPPVTKQPPILALASGSNQGGRHRGNARGKTAAGGQAGVGQSDDTGAGDDGLDSGAGPASSPHRRLSDQQRGGPAASTAGLPAAIATMNFGGLSTQPGAGVVTSAAQAAAQAAAARQQEEALRRGASDTDRNHQRSTVPAGQKAGGGMKKLRTSSAFPTGAGKEEKLREIVIPLGAERLPQAEIVDAIKVEFGVRYCEMIGVAPTPANVVMAHKAVPLAECSIRQVIHPGLGRGERRNYVTIVPPCHKATLAKRAKERAAQNAIEERQEAEREARAAQRRAGGRTPNLRAGAIGDVSSVGVGVGGAPVDAAMSPVKTYPRDRPTGVGLGAGLMPFETMPQSESASNAAAMAAQFKVPGHDAGLDMPEAPPHAPGEDVVWSDGPKFLEYKFRFVHPYALSSRFEGEADIVTGAKDLTHHGVDPDALYGQGTMTSSSPRNHRSNGQHPQTQMQSGSGGKHTTETPPDDGSSSMPIKPYAPHSHDQGAAAQSKSNPSVPVPVSVVEAKGTAAFRSGTQRTIGAPTAAVYRPGDQKNGDHKTDAGGGVGSFSGGGMVGGYGARKPTPAQKRLHPDSPRGPIMSMYSRPPTSGNDAGSVDSPIKKSSRTVVIGGSPETTTKPPPHDPTKAQPGFTSGAQHQTAPTRGARGKPGVGAAKLESSKLRQKMAGWGVPVSATPNSHVHHQAPESTQRNDGGDSGAGGMGPGEVASADMRRAMAQLVNDAALATSDETNAERTEDGLDDAARIALSRTNQPSSFFAPEFKKRSVAEAALSSSAVLQAGGGGHAPKPLVAKHGLSSDLNAEDDETSSSSSNENGGMATNRPSHSKGQNAHHRAGSGRSITVTDSARVHAAERGELGRESTKVFRGTSVHRDGDDATGEVPGLLSPGGETRVPADFEKDDDDFSQEDSRQNPQEAPQASQASQHQQQPSPRTGGLPPSDAPLLERYAQRELDVCGGASTDGDLRQLLVAFARDFPFDVYAPRELHTPLRRLVVSDAVVQAATRVAVFFHATYIAPATALGLEWVKQMLAAKTELARKAATDVFGRKAIVPGSRPSSSRSRPGSSSAPPAAATQVRPPQETGQGPKRELATAAEKDRVFLEMCKVVLELTTALCTDRAGAARDFPMVILALRVVVEADVRQKLPTFSQTAPGMQLLRRMDSVLWAILDPDGVASRIPAVDGAIQSRRVLKLKRPPKQIPGGPRVTSPIAQLVLAPTHAQAQAQAQHGGGQQRRPKHLDTGMSELREHVTPMVRADLLQLLADTKFAR